MFDGGEWEYGYNHDMNQPETLRHFVESAASPADVRLYLNGNFSGNKEAREFGERLASFLNGEN